MIVQIKVRSDNGRYKEATPGEFAEYSLRHCLDMGGGNDGWRWFRDWLCRVLIDRAKACQSSAADADKWYRRYQSLREIQ